MGWLPPKLRGVWAVLGAAGLALVLAGVDRMRREPRTAPMHEAWETDPALWGRQHPRQYGTWKQEPSAKAARPLEPGLFAGYGAGADGAEPASSAHPVACQTCHDPATMALRVTRPAFLQALAKQGLDPARMERSELRTYVCAQCHSIPSAKGREWRHAVSGTSLSRVRHPQFELWREGIHAKREGSCPDCHMPRVTEGTARFTDHHLGSPLERVHASCMGCHHGGEATLRDRVKAMQETTRSLQARTAQALREGHASLAQASGPEADALRSKLRQAQQQWDAVAADGSKGFHAPQESARQLGEALDLARQASLEARKLMKR